MANNLVIVESPAKSKTIKKYLGEDFEILATYGHVRDLEPKKGSVNTEDNFSMKYHLIDRNKKHIDAIKKAAKQAKTIYLATDPDREGEAISWHVQEILTESKIIKDKQLFRVAFNEITKHAVTNAIANPRSIAMPLVNAQQTRRALDFLVGFNLSPLLWKKIRRGLSAGRVQSPALRMIVEREIEIEAFKSQEYWSITANLNKTKKFSAKLINYYGEKQTQFSIINEEQAKSVVENITTEADGYLVVKDIKKKKVTRNPSPPFNTSTLQQESSKKLGFTTKKTMIVAQQLYEGIELGKEGSVGLITYMRTDSNNFSTQAIEEIRNYIAGAYGEKSVPSKPRTYKSKTQNAQEAHEAIRPADVFKKPEDIEKYLNKDQFKLYSLIWKRSVACQMISATLNSVAIEFITDNKQHAFKSTGSVIAKPGFLSVYQESKDEDEKESDEGIILPSVEIDQKINLNDILSKQHFTEAPPRFTEASLVKSLEHHGIGRPSTYSAIISTLQQREYAIIETKRFKPTDVGRVVNKFLTDHFEKYVEYNYTAKLEGSLDDIAADKIEWIPVLQKFWKSFIEQIAKTDADVKKSDVTQEKIDEKCPECSGDLSIRLGRNGRFIGCTKYPECKYTRQLNDSGEESKDTEPTVVEDRKCPSCESDLHVKQGRYGKFIGCSSYPNCKHMEPLEKPKDTGVQCPLCKKNNIIEKKSRKGKVFYACSGYPKCKNAFWYPPLEEKCKKCDSPILLHKTTKKDGEQKVCPIAECDYAVPFEE